MFDMSWVFTFHIGCVIVHPLDFNVEYVYVVLFQTNLNDSDFGYHTYDVTNLR